MEYPEPGKTVFTGWRVVTPGNCIACGFDDGWSCDGRGSITCECQQCPGCNRIGYHEPFCSEHPDFDDEDISEEEGEES